MRLYGKIESFSSENQLSMWGQLFVIN